MTAPNPQVAVVQVPGLPGSPGPANTLTIGTVATLSAGSNATAMITGTAPSQILSLGIPSGLDGVAGATGPAGPANSLTIGTVTTGAAGSSASATISGTAPSQTLNLVIPQGIQGATGAGAPDATSSTKGSVQLAGDLAGTAAAPTVPGLTGKTPTTRLITAGTGLTGGGDLSADRTLTVTYGAASGTAVQGNDIRVAADQIATQASIRTIGTGALQAAAGNHTHTPASIGAAAAVHTHVATTDLTATGTKDTTTFLRGDNTWAAPTGTSAPDATTTVKGIIQLAGDLAGTAAAPTVPGLTGKASTTRLITAGTGLTGGGDLSADRTLAVAYGSAASTAVQGNDIRVIADGITTQASIRTLGTGAQQAAAGNHTHTAANITDSTTVGRSVLTAVDAPTARTAIGAGTSSLVIGTVGGTAKDGAYQPTAANISDATTVGRSVLTAVDAPTARTAIGAGTSSLVIGTTNTTAKAGDYQPAAANISDSTTVGRSVITAASATAARTATGAAPILTPTATKTAAYTAAVGDLAMMNVAGGATTLTLPTAPADKSQVGYRAIGATTGTPMVLNSGGTDTIGTAGATTASIPLADESTVLQYDAPNTRWLGVANVKTMVSTDARYAASVHTHTAANISDSTTVGRSVLTAASAQAARTALATNGVSGGITDIQQITQTAYTALGGSTVSTTMYVIVG